jgi:hypothetical protein
MGGGGGWNSLRSSLLVQTPQSNPILVVPLGMGWGSGENSNLDNIQSHSSTKMPSQLMASSVTNNHSTHVQFQQIPVQILWRREKSLAPAMNQTWFLGCPTCSLVTRPTTLSCLIWTLYSSGSQHGPYGPSGGPHQISMGPQENDRKLGGHSNL